MLVATDERHRTADPLLTVTTDDARRANLTVEDLAQQWQASLQSSLLAALERRQPEAIHRNAEFIVWAAVALAILTLAGIVLFRFLRNRTAATIVAWIVPVLWLAAITSRCVQFPQTVGYGQSVIAHRGASGVGLDRGFRRRPRVRYRHSSGGAWVGEVR